MGGYSNGPSSPYFIGHDYPEFVSDQGNMYKKEDGTLVHFQSVFSVPNRYTYSDPEAPTFIVTYAQTQFLLAEAAVRGYVNGDAATYFKNALEAACNQFSQFPAKGAASLVETYLTADAVNTFVTAMVADFNAASNDGKLEMINTQYWVNSFGDEYEAFSNWRRSGYPVLKASPFCAGQSTYTFADGATATADGNSASNGIPRRFRYPTSEDQINTANYKEAVSRMAGGDRFDSRVWWDK